MLVPNAISLLSLLALLPFISAAPARERREATFDQVRGAVVAFVHHPAPSPASFETSELSVAGPQNVDEPHSQLVGQPEEVKSHDWYAASAIAPEASESLSPVANAKVLAVDANTPEPSGHWQIYTTSTWIGESLEIPSVRG